MRPFGEWASAEAYAETTANLVVGEFGFLLADREPKGEGWTSVVWQCRWTPRQGCFPEGVVAGIGERP